MFVQHCPRCSSSRIQRGYNDPPLLLRAAGIYDLLCNDCDLEFRGFALPGTVKRAPSNLQSKLSGGLLTGYRRRAPRVKVHVPTRVLIYETKKKISGTQYSPVLGGYTRDISEIGVATVLPPGFTDEYPTKGHPRMYLTLELPGEAVQVYATAVRYELLAGSSADQGVLVGARITKISPGDRARLHNYIEVMGQEA